ncbi:type II toxin-antitoxin system RelE/ParE family toxin [Alteromonas halophila]|uniref:Uncharacterized protein n=1 Tax=Alteromonas halophila TaxID=516698 RepID=A0A918JGD7_9ALTE|nr:type II toxin-antitoxin system RelE/ParE family toxin [Alteromonas halophila]GGW79666.1 hypothetical protein GCM10007391_10580 [Alteromonas halophila]
MCLLYAFCHICWALLRVYKFEMGKQLTLPGYSYEDGSVILELIALGSRKNYYRNVKK